VLAEVAPEVRVVAVQTQRVPAFAESLRAGEPVSVPVKPTMADGIAVGRPGDVPFAVLRRLGVEVREVSEEDLSHALLLVVERSKLVVEPAGAAGVAALLAGGPGAGEPFEGPVVAVLSGGNIDPLVLLRVIRHGMVAAGRYLKMRVMLDDRPGSLANLLGELAGLGGNIMHIDHTRTDVGLGLNDVWVPMQIETKGPEHCDAIVSRLREVGYRVVRD